MADKREAYAGDLSSEAIGKTVVVPAHGADGERRGVVLAATHGSGLTGKPITTVLVQPHGSSGVQQAWTVGATVVVEVRAARAAVVPGGDAA
jgi:hypothetical protein